MKAIETNLLEFLKGQKQFIIPIYQRTYSWNDEQCEQLWKDIVKTAQNDDIPGHFIGSIVYINQGIYQISAIPQMLVIDGQQRLTTVSLILFALGQAMQKADQEKDQRRINNYFLFNSEEEGELRQKLILTQKDKSTLIRLMEGQELIDPVARRVQENYKYFAEQIEKCEVSLDTIYKGIAKLIIVDISLDRRHDNPQLIFESLNSTGLELSQADLIRNFVLMGLQPQEQEELYNAFWYPMEQSFGQIDYSKNFDRFMRDYLTVKTGKIARIQEVYQAFKIYANSHRDVSMRDLVADIYSYSKNFVSMALEKEDDDKLRGAFIDINGLRVEVAYPLLLEMYADYQSSILSHDDFLHALRLIESYVFRRFICGIPTNSLNKTFATFSKSLDKSDYLNSIKANLVLKDSYRRFPTDAEFSKELGVRDLYNIRIRSYWLRKFENHGRKEFVDVDGYTIEHILPQNENMSADWKAELGENWKGIQATYLHTIGNLTLTGYNSEYSDLPFAKKRDMKDKQGQSVGFSGSPLRLNVDLGGLEHWNEQEILKRAARLTQQASQVWVYPSIEDAVLEKYKIVTKEKESEIYTLEDHKHLSGDMLDLFQLLRTHVLNIDPSVHEEILKLYIAYKTSTNFVDVIAHKKKLILSLNMKFSEVEDSKKLCKDVTDLGRWGNGDVQIEFSSQDQLSDVLVLIRQSYARHSENGD
jgi:uncharacterized protein with ParB-like and HNH nuclease domain/predicted transport protein